jgi:hypothetical protein
MTAKWEGILMARSESRLEVESSLVEQKLQAHPHADIDIARRECTGDNVASSNQRGRTCKRDHG